MFATEAQLRCPGRARGLTGKTACVGKGGRQNSRSLRIIGICIAELAIDCDVAAAQSQIVTTKESLEREPPARTKSIEVVRGWRASKREQTEDSPFVVGAGPETEHPWIIHSNDRPEGNPKGD